MTDIINHSAPGGAMSEVQARATLNGPLPDDAAAARFAEFMKGRGLDPSATLAAHGHGPVAPVAPVVQPDAPKPPASSNVGFIDPITKQIALSPAETAAAKAKLLAVGVSQADIDAALAGSPQPSLDERDASERGFDKAFPVPASPAEYRFEYGPERAGAVDAADLQALDTELKAGMFAMRASPAAASATVTAMLKSSDAWDAAAGPDGANKEAVALFQRGEVAKFGQLAAKPFGDMQAGLFWAAEALRCMEPAARKALFDNKSIETAEVLIQLAFLGRNLYVRQGLTEQRKAKK